MKIVLEGNTVRDLRREARKFLDQTPAGNTCPACGWDLDPIHFTTEKEAKRLSDSGLIQVICSNPNCAQILEIPSSRPSAELAP